MIATHVSRPIRSASASGPIGWAKPSFAIVSIASGLGDAVVERPDRLVDERHQDAVRDEAGEVVRLGRRLAELAREPRSPRPSRRRSAAAHDLDELQHRHRVEEVHADHAVGPRRSRPRASVIGIEDVLDARIAPRRQRLVGAAEDLLLHVPRPRRRPRSSGRRGRARRPARHAPSTSSGSRAALLRELREALAHRRERRARSRRARVVERDAAPEAATTCAIPPPICPAPTTRTCSNFMYASLLTRPRHSSRRTA